MSVTSPSRRMIVNNRWVRKSRSYRSRSAPARHRSPRPIAAAYAVYKSRSTCETIEPTISVDVCAQPALPCPYDSLVERKTLDDG